MMIQRFSIASLAMGLLMTATSSFAQLSVGAGAKQFTFNDQVGKNQLIWVSEAPLENIKGSAEGVTGSFTIDPKNLAATKGTVSASVATMKTGNATRDNHLASAAWMNAARFPSITFTIGSLSNVKANGGVATATAVGDFTLHGVTKHMSIPVKITYLPESAKTRERATGDLVMISGDFQISLKDFNIEGTNGLVGSKVGETIKITAQFFGNSR